MDLTSALLSKELVVAAASVAANIALWRALQKERDDRISDMHKGFERETTYLHTLRDLKEVISALRQDIATRGPRGRFEENQ